jgi:hypothetical protein
MMKHLYTKNLSGGLGLLAHTIIGHTGLVGGQVEVMADMESAAEEAALLEEEEAVVADAAVVVDTEVVKNIYY